MIAMKKTQMIEPSAELFNMVMQLQRIATFSHQTHKHRRKSTKRKRSTRNTRSTSIGIEIEITTRKGKKIMI